MLGITRNGPMRHEFILESRWQAAVTRLRVGLRNGIGWCLERFKAPAKLKVFEFVDPASDETVYLYTSKVYSVLCVGDRRFYFDRITGKFDGVSSPPTALSVADGLKFSD